MFGYRADQSKKELAFFYRREALDKWLEAEVDLNDKGGNFYKVILKRFPYKKFFFFLFYVIFLVSFL